MELSRKYEHFLMQHITWYNGQWYCYLCKLENLTDVERHLQEVHPNRNKITIFFDKPINGFEAMYKKLLNNGIAMKETSDNTKYFCVPCKCSIPTLDHVDQHLKGKNHQRYMSIMKPLIVKPELLDNRIVMKDIKKNCDTTYFCVSCNCLIPTLKHVNQHVKGKKHQKCGNCTKSENFPNEPQDSNKNTNGNVSVNAKNQILVCENKLAKNNSTNEIKEKEEKVTSLEFYGKDDNSNILQIEKNMNMIFCTLCDMFENKINKENHIQDMRHISTITSLKVFDEQAIHILNLEENKKIIKPLQLNSKKLDGTMWPEDTKISKYTCDQCNIMIGTNDVINHEITVHINNMSCLRYAYDLMSVKSSLNSDTEIFNYYPMFKCAFCNEIIHGISVLKNHFSKCRHEQNIKFLFEIKKEEYRHSKNIESFFEILEFLNLISFENNDDTVQIMEQPVIYIKNHRSSLYKSSDNLVQNKKNKFTYICIACKCKFYEIQSVFEHLMRRKHLKHFQNILPTYNHIYNICTTKELGINKTQAAESLNCIETTSTNTLEEYNINEAQIVQDINNYSDLIDKANTDTKDGILSQSGGSKVEENTESQAAQDIDNYSDLIAYRLTANNTKNDVLFQSGENKVEEYNINQTQKAQDIDDYSDLINKANTDTKDDILSQSEESQVEENEESQAVQGIDNHSNLIPKANIDTKYDILSQSGESNSGLLMSIMISSQMETQLKSPLEELKFLQTKRNNNAYDRYNRMYNKTFLDFEKYMFTYNSDQLNEIKSSLELYTLKSGKMHCLACNFKHSKDIHTLYEHIRCENHIRQFVQLNKSSQEQRMKFLKELMEMNYTNWTCHACNKKEKCIHNYYKSFEEHIYYPAHKKNRKMLLKNVESVLQESDTLWYHIGYFACVPCNKRFYMKIEFMEHLNNNFHGLLSRKDNSKFDFCVTCATLWYKSRNSQYSQHCQKQMHQYLARSNDFAVMPLPQSMQELLNNINETVIHLFESSNKALNDSTSILLNDLKNTFETQQFNVEVCPFGSRVTGSALPNSDIDIYLNFRDKHIKAESIQRRSEQIQNCLHTDNENWEIESILDRCRTPILKVKHIRTRLQCDISFTNSLSLENTKLIKIFNTAYPPCKKLILFLKKWFLLGDLTGSDGITSYALSWLIIFYLQVEHKIPSVADLIKSHNCSKIVSGWETGIGDNVPINVPELSIYDLLLGFFKYYGRFDYMNDIVCPLLGVICHKKDFAEVSTLPDTMALYVTQLKSAKPEYFRIDSSMCVQDPFDLSHNLTKAVPILILKRFKQYCNESASELSSAQIRRKKKKIID